MTDQEYKKDFQNCQDSPIKDKSCTDIPCCIIYLLATLAFFVIAGFAFVNGDPRILAQPYDMDHQPCGIKGNEDYKFIYFPNPTKLTENVCVQQCPQKNQKSVKCLKNKICEKGELTQSPTTLIYESQEIYEKICIPADKDFNQKIQASINIDQAESLVSDLRNTWMICSSSAFMAIIIGFLFMIVIRLCAGSVIWLFIILILTVLVCLGLLFLFQYRQLTNPIDVTASKEAQQVQEAMRSFEDKNACLGIAITLLSMAGLFFLFVICSCNRIKLCVQITKPGSLPFGQVQMTTQIKAMGWIHIFALFWNECFIFASFQFIVVGAVAYWYYQVPEIDDSHTTMSAKTYFKNHMGTAAFGSFLLGLIWFLQVIVQTIENQAKNAGGSENAVAKFIFKCLDYCLACCAECVKKINQNVYVVSFVKGESFCSAVSSFLGLFASNPLRISLVSGFGYFFEVLGNFAISGLTTLICYYIITGTEYYQARVENPFAPLFIIAVISFFVGSFVMGLFSIAGETMIVIYCIQEAGGSKKSGNCPQELSEFMEEKN